MKQTILPVILIFTALVACNDQSADDAAANRKDGYTKVANNKEDSLYNEVIEGHDVGMARMGKLRKYSGSVQQALDSIAKLPASAANTNLKQALQELHTELQQAQQGMNAWMETFNPDSASGDKTVRIQYLESEKIKVTVVKERILNSLQKADSLFKALPSK